MNVPVRVNLERRHRPIGPADGGAPSSRLRIALYSHDTLGIGHTRRNLLIAQSLVRSDLHPTILLVTGVPHVGLFAVPPGVDCLTMPAMRKKSSGTYRSRSLDLTFEDLVRLRSATIRAALEQFQPDVFIVDKVPRGAGGELDETLASLRGSGRTRCVLGLRDVLDEPAAVNAEWREAGNVEAIRDFYDAVWVYGDPSVFDFVKEYEFGSEIAGKVSFTGYLDQQQRLEFADDEPRDELAMQDFDGKQLVSCLVGGGEDGARLAYEFARIRFPSNIQGVLVTGPFMPGAVKRLLHRQAAKGFGLSVVDFLAEPARLVCRSDRVIAMGGYNTVAEILSFRKRALIVPRVQPRQEQWIRAQRLSERGLVDVLHPDNLSPEALLEWILGTTSPPASAWDGVDLGGLARLPILLEELLVRPRHRKPRRAYLQSHK